MYVYVYVPPNGGQDEAQDGQDEAQDGQAEAQDAQNEVQDGQDEIQDGQEVAGANERQTPGHPVKKHA